MKDLTDVNLFEPVITVPEDGIDPRTAASIEDAFQKLANRTFNLLQNVLPIQTDVGFLQTKNLSFCADRPDASDTEWSLTVDTTNALRYVESLSAGDHARLWPVHGLPVGWTITEYALILKGPSVHVADIGPRVQLYKMDLTTTTAGTVVGAGATDGTNAAGYDDWHQLEVTVGSPPTIIEGDTFFMLINGERGSGALAGVQIAGFRIKCVTT